MKKVTLAVVLLALVAVAGYYIFRTSQRAPQPIAETPSPAPQRDLSSVFDLAKKATGTKLYYSDKLGVGFTYLAWPEYSSTLQVTETATRVGINDQSIEIFTKDPEQTLAEAIQGKFLQGYDPRDCFVKVSETSEQNLPSYVAAEISYPTSTDPSAPWWQNSDKCPRGYSQTNGMQYFLMNKDVLGKFAFVKIGQYSAASDGTPRTEPGGVNWTHSIRILE